MQPKEYINADESGFSTNLNQKKTFFKKSSRDAYMITPTCGKAIYTVLATGNAAGEYMPPLVVYKAQYLNDTWTINGPKDATYAVTESGWMSDVIFEQWFWNSFIPHVSSTTKPVIIFLDGHGSHLTYGTVKLAIKNQIIIICLPAHTSHALQPLDVGVFKGLKADWRRILLRFYRETRMTAVDKGSFPTLLKQSWQCFCSQNLVGGFRGAGLCPFNSDVVSLEKFQNILEDPTTPDDIGSPQRILCEAIVSVIAPTPSAETITALENSKKKRKWVEASSGEVLASDEVVERLRIEEEERVAKKK